MRGSVKFVVPFIALLAAVLVQLPLSGGRTPPQTVVNSLGIKLVRIEPGTFSRGSAGGDFDEQPVHSVSIRQPFWMAATEITNAQYEQFDPTHKKYRGQHGCSQGDDEAVLFVSWQDARRFCEWLSKKESKPYRLPTEAEWEYACRAGTTTAFSTGDALPAAYLKKKGNALTVGQTPANAWGLFDMHGNAEEWCHDWYGPYPKESPADPVGYATGDFRVTRGGSHGTEAFYLRSANRQGSLPGDKHWLIGFRIVQAELPKAEPLSPLPVPRWGQEVSQRKQDWSGGPAAEKPYFRGPRQYVFIPADADGPLFARHNHQPALTACPNGDLLAIWYSCRTEPGRELAVAAARLRHGADKWEPAAPFWDTPDRNDHGSALLWDGQQTLYHFNGLAVARGWGELALIMRTSTDNGATWSAARLISPEHRPHHQVIEGAFQTKEGFLVVPCDAVPGGRGGTVLHISKDNGQTWQHPAAGRPQPTFTAGGRGAWIAGIHAGVTQLKNGSLLAFGRGDTINGQMPQSVSTDLGQNWTYQASVFPPLGGGQRLVLQRLREGPLLLASFAAAQKIKDSAGQERTVSGLFGALSYDEGKTWPVRRLITDDRPARLVDGGGNTRRFLLGPNSSEPRGYLSCTQSPDGVIHLLSSKQHYAFNLRWLETPMPAAAR